MYISLDWLQDYISIPKNITPEKLGELLTMHTVEVEEIRNLGESLNGIVVGKILKIKKHPDADKLKLAVVSTGIKKYNVVCGGSNLSEGMLVAFAKVGAKIKSLPSKQGGQGHDELVELKPAVIRGEKSEGMICASSEIGLDGLFPAEDEAEVVDLKGNYKTGEPLAKALGLDDIVYDIDNKSMTHRPDLWAHHGIARELATLMDTNLKSINTDRINVNNKIKLAVKVKDKKLCPRYMVVAVEGIKIKPSPEWIQKRLIACDVRPINNIVDITNYVMLELGQPTHAFDAEKLGNTIIIRRAKKGEELITLDSEKRKLDQEMLLITNKKAPVAIAGVMGGGNSEIDNTTTSVIIEAANFDAVNIRQTSQKLGLRSEASTRFEKSLDPALCELALQRIVSLVKESCSNSKVVSNIVDVKNYKEVKKIIKLDLVWLNEKIGVVIPKAKAISILKNLGFGVTGGNILNVTVPSWRATKDVDIPEDLVEEVARIYGYSNIKMTMSKVSMEIPAKNKEREFVEKISDMLVATGMTEVYNYSFVNEDQLAKLKIDSKDYIKLANPLTQDHTLLRQSLAPNLLQNVITNQRNFVSIKLFEIGSVFLSSTSDLAKSANSKDKLPDQPLKLGLVLAGNGKDNFYKLKGVIENLGASLNINFEFTKDKEKIIIKINNRLVGEIIDFNNTPAIGLKTRAIIYELDIAKLLAAHQRAGKQKYVAKNKFPFVLRDMAFVIDEKILYNEIRNEIINFDELIQAIELFDVYVGDKIGQGKKSVAFHISFGNPTKTLTGEEIDLVQKKLANRLAKKFKAQLRDF